MTNIININNNGHQWEDPSSLEGKNWTQEKEDELRVKIEKEVGKYHNTKRSWDKKQIEKTLEIDCGIPGYHPLAIISYDLPENTKFNQYSDFKAFLEKYGYSLPEQNLPDELKDDFEGFENPVDEALFIRKELLKTIAEPTTKEEIENLEKIKKEIKELEKLQSIGSSILPEGLSVYRNKKANENENKNEKSIENEKVNKSDFNINDFISNVHPNAEKKLKQTKNKSNDNTHKNKILKSNEDENEYKLKKENDLLKRKMEEQQQLFEQHLQRKQPVGQGQLGKSTDLFGLASIYRTMKNNKNASSLKGNNWTSGQEMSNFAKFRSNTIKNLSNDASVNLDRILNNTNLKGEPANEIESAENYKQLDQNLFDLNNRVNEAKEMLKNPNMPQNNKKDLIKTIENVKKVTDKTNELSDEQKEKLSENTLKIIEALTRFLKHIFSFNKAKDNSPVM